MEISSAQYSNKEEMKPIKMLKLSVPQKRTALYLLAFILAVLITGIIFSIGIRQSEVGIIRKALYILVILLIGTSHLFIFNKWESSLWGPTEKKEIMYTLLIATAIFFINAAFFYLFHLATTSWAFTAALGFLLPPAVKFCWDHLNEITKPLFYEPWLLTTGVSEQKVSLFLNSVQLSLKLNLHADDEQEKVFAITVPGRMKIGEMFQGFLIDKTAQRIQIQLLNKNNEAFAWNFSVKKFPGNKMLDPFETISNSGIKKGDIIIARRIDFNNSLKSAQNENLYQ